MAGGGSLVRKRFVSCQGFDLFRVPLSAGSWIRAGDDMKTAPFVHRVQIVFFGARGGGLSPDTEALQSVIRKNGWSS
jgi:hypothetical protein